MSATSTFMLTVASSVPPFSHAELAALQLELVSKRKKDAFCFSPVGSRRVLFFFSVTFPHLTPSASSSPLTSSSTSPCETFCAF